MDRISCPFCNARFEPPPAGRVTCPRCAEAVPVRGREATADAPTPAAHVPASGFRWPPVALVVGIVVVFGIGAAYSILRTSRVTDPAATLGGAPVAPPAQLAGLKYLPAESNVVFVVQPAAVFRHAARIAGNPTDELVKVGVPVSVLAALGKGGVSLDAIDHVAGGGVIPDAGELRLGIALVLRQPVHDEARFLDALQARRPAAANPPHYSVDLGGAPLKLVKVSDTVWLFGFTDRDLTPVGNGLSDRMRTALTDTIPADAAACLLTDSENWAAKPAVTLLLTVTGKADWQPGVAKVRTVAAGLTLTDPPTLRVMAMGATPAARGELRDAFQRQPGTTGETGEWVHLDMPAERAGGLAALRAVFAPR